MAVINQTNRTILFEEINPEKLDLLTIVGDTKGMDSLNDEKIKEINEKLLVTSFQEFVEKFDPVVYSFFNANNQKVCYTLKKPEGIPEDMLSEIHLNLQNDFMKMLVTLVDAKRSQGLLNVDFKFENLTDLFSPRKVMEDIRQNRKELQYTYGQYAELDDDDPKKMDLGDKLNIMMEEASTNYNNVMAMLPLAIEDIKTRLLLTGGAGGKDDAPLAVGMLTMGEEGELKILEAPKQDDTRALALVDNNVNAGLVEVLEEDYEAVNEGQSNDYVKALVVRTFCPLPSTNVSNIDTEKEVANYNTYLEFYRNAKDDFIKCVKPLIEKLLGVKSFFDQYPVKMKGMRPSLLITNIKNDMLVKANNIPRLQTYLNTVNAKNDYTNTIWYGIFPSVGMEAAKKANIRQRFKGNSNDKVIESNTIESLTAVMEVLKDYRVQCFFSFDSNEKNTFTAMAVDGIERYVDRCQILAGKDYSEFAIPCIPNFTIIPKDKSGVVLDNKMTIDENDVASLSKAKEDIMKLWIDGIYVSSAYVAAGLTAAVQSPDYLKEKFKTNVDPQLPGVRFNFEEGDNSLIATTTLAKEITGFTNSIKDEINKNCFGFVFSSENATLDGKNVTNIMVYKARNMMTDIETGIYESIFKTQVTTYVERILRQTTSDFKQDKIEFFFGANPASTKSQWVAKGNKLNGILGNGVDVTCEIDAVEGVCNLGMVFNGNVRNLQLVVNRA